MEDILIFGAGGLGREVAFLIDRINRCKTRWNLLGFIDDTPELQGKTINGIAVLGTSSYFEHHPQNTHLICALGDPQNKKNIIERLSKYPNIKFATLIDPQAVVSETAEIGCGSLVFANTIITVNVIIHKHQSLCLRL
jgi:FlaA1/EpsC-like NDP-sugar epimerase